MQPALVMRAYLPPDYPAVSPPVLELAAPHMAAEQLEAAVRRLEAAHKAGEAAGHSGDA